MLILKTPGGNPVGYVRTERENGKSNLTIVGVKTADLQVVAMNAENCETLTADHQGRCESEFEPDALALVNQRGDVFAVAAPRGAQEAVISRARQRVKRNDAPPKTEPKSEDPQAESESAKPPQQEMPPTDEITLRQNPPDARSACRAWPPPPFFPDAQFKDGAWRV